MLFLKEVSLVSLQKLHQRNLLFSIEGLDMGGGKKDAEDPGNKDSEIPSTKEPRVNQEKDENVNSTNNINIVSPTINFADIEENIVDENIVYGCADDPNIPNLEEIDRFVSPTIYSSCIEQFWAIAKVKYVNEEAQLHAKVDGKKVVISKALIRRDLRFGDEGDIGCLPNEAIFEQLTLMEVVVDEAIYEEMYDSVKRATTTATGLDAERDKGDPGAKRPWGMLLLRLDLREVLDLETTKTAQAKEIANLKKRFKRLKRKKKSRSHGLKRLYKVRLSARVESSTVEESLGEEESSKHRRIEDIDADENITHVNDQEMFDADRDLQALMEIKTSKPKAKGIVLQEPSETTTITIPTISSKVQEKGKGIMVEEPLKIKKKDQISFDHQEAMRLQAKIYEEERLVGERARLAAMKAQKALEANIVVIEQWEDIRKFFAAKRAEKDKGSISQDINSKRARDDLEQENAKKQRVEEENDSAELKRCLEIVPDDEDDVTI
uniref:Xylulose kinase-1 n=1 Tax=Tanacetum cinerariifolium TaxID=118510 RepID=A0A6L2KYB2_TANCI|nr:hypothetical protein [Tanacetum cinerariifolium]